MFLVYENVSVLNAKHGMPKQCISACVILTSSLCWEAPCMSPVLFCPFDQSLFPHWWPSYLQWKMSYELHARKLLLGLQWMLFHIIAKVRDGATFSLLRGCYALLPPSKRAYHCESRWAIAVLGRLCLVFDFCFLSGAEKTMMPFHGHPSVSHCTNRRDKCPKKKKEVRFRTMLCFFWQLEKITHSSVASCHRRNLARGSSFVLAAPSFAVISLLSDYSPWSAVHGETKRSHGNHPRRSVRLRPDAVETWRVFVIKLKQLARLSPHRPAMQGRKKPKKTSFFCSLVC